jgi:hypothetical protein
MDTDKQDDFRAVVFRVFRLFRGSLLSGATAAEQMPTRRAKKCRAKK